MSGIYVIIPTYNEAENIEKLITKILDINRDFQIIVVDDNSPDGTADLAQNINQLYGNIFVIRRSAKLGIGSAILDGMKKALSFPDCEHIITMDADLSHDPEDIPQLLDVANTVDLVQGSRYIKGGGTVGWTLYRKFISRLANFLYRHLFNLHQHEITTYFRVYSRRCVEAIVQNVSTRRYEFALSSLLVLYDHGFTVKEVPIIFVNRVQGKSKIRTSDIIQSIRYMIYIFILRLYRNVEVTRFIKFCIVGFSGIIVNQGLLFLLTDIIGMYYLHSAIIAIESSIASNFILNDFWTFKDIKILAGSIFQRFIKYNLLCIMGASLNYVVLWVFTDLLHMNYLISNLFGIAVAVIWNYTISLKWAWSKKYTTP